MVYKSNNTGRQITPLKNLLRSKFQLHVEGSKLSGSDIKNGKNKEYHINESDQKTLFILIHGRMLSYHGSDFTAQKIEEWGIPQDWVPNQCNQKLVNEPSQMVNSLSLFLTSLIGQLE